MLIKFLDKESSDKTAHTRRISIPTRTGNYIYGIAVCIFYLMHCVCMFMIASSSGLGIEFIKGNRVVRYHPAPINPPAGDIDEHNDVTSCLGTIAQLSL